MEENNGDGDEKRSPGMVLADFLEKFVSEERRDMDHPVRKNGFAYATNGKVAVRVKMHDDEAADEKGDFSDKDCIVDKISNSVDNIFKANMENKPVKVFFGCLDTEFIKKFRTENDKAQKYFVRNEEGHAECRCPCCSAELYYSREDETLYEQFEYDESKRRILSGRICLKVVLNKVDADDSLEDRIQYFPGEPLSDIIELSIRRNDPIKEAYVCGKLCLVLRGTGWEAIMTKRYTDDDKRITVIGESYEIK